MKIRLLLLQFVIICHALADQGYVVRIQHWPVLAHKFQRHGRMPYTPHSFVWVQRGAGCRTAYGRYGEDGASCITFQRKRGVCKAGTCVVRSTFIPGTNTRGVNGIYPFVPMPPTNSRPNPGERERPYVTRFPAPAPSPAPEPSPEPSPEPEPLPEPAPSPGPQPIPVTDSEEEPTTDPELDPRRIPRRLIMP